jgi:predicted dehydrogenase
MTESLKRIGYVDYKLDNFHANVYLKILRGELKERGYAVAGCTAARPKEGRAWAEANQVPYYRTVAELNAHVDVFMVLAPSNPETHLALCEQVLPCGKTTYVDKTFAPDLATARQIFALADQHGCAMQTTSALRYTNVQACVSDVGRASVRHLVAWGGGRSFGEYAIHPVELAVSCMGPKVESLMRRGTGRQSQLLLNFSGGRTAVVNVYVNAQTPFAASVTTNAGTQIFTVDDSRLFVDTAAAILGFFDAGRPSIDRAESLAIRAILDAAGSPRALKEFVKL